LQGLTEPLDGLVFRLTGQDSLARRLLGTSERQEHDYAHNLRLVRIFIVAGVPSTEELFAAYTEVVLGGIVEELPRLSIVEFPDMPVFSSYCASHNALRSNSSLASISSCLLQRNPQSLRKKIRAGAPKDPGPKEDGKGILLA